MDRQFRLLLSFCGNQRKESRERHGKDIGRVGEEVMKQGGKMCVVGRFPTECSFYIKGATGLPPLHLK